MVGVVFVAHENIAIDMVNTAEVILGRKLINFRCLSVPFDVNVQQAGQQLIKYIEEVNFGEGVLLLTDFLGGTPSNICTNVLDRHDVELVYGTNLAMIIKLARTCDKYKLGELANFIKKYGIEHINIIQSEKQKR